MSAYYFCARGAIQIINISTLDIFSFSHDTNWFGLIITNITMYITTMSICSKITFTIVIISA